MSPGVGFLAVREFFSIFEDSKNRRFFDVSPVAQQIGKIGPSGNIKPIQGKRLDPQVSVFGNQRPREPAFSRAQANRKRAKGKQQTRNKPKKGSNTPIGRWPGEFYSNAPRTPPGLYKGKVA